MNEVKNFSWTAIFILLAIVVVGMVISQSFIGYNNYDAAGRPAGTSKPKATVPLTDPAATQMRRAS